MIVAAMNDAVADIYLTGGVNRHGSSRLPGRTTWLPQPIGNTANVRFTARTQVGTRTARGNRDDRKVDTGSNPRDQGVDEPVSGDSRGERGNRLELYPEAECRTAPTPLKGCPTGVINAADATLREGRWRRPSFRT